MKREFWKRKRTKRRKRAEADRGIVDFIKVVKHFFTSLPDWISEMEDPRNESYILYTQSDLICMGLLKNVCSVPSMRQMEDLFNEECCIKTLAILSGNPELEEMPHSDTLNYYLSRLSPECLDGLRTRMVRSLIRSKNFNNARLLDKYWRIILDGTGLYVFHERHCDNCLKQLVKGEDGTKKTIYYHKVLEAKIVLGGGFVISIGTEFIENESLDVTKQDCELNAAKRLLPRIKEKFPRLPIILQADALYEAESMMELCRHEWGWEYLFTHKDGKQRYIGEEYNFLDDEDKTVVPLIGKEQGHGKYFNGVENITGKTEKMNLFEYKFTKVEDGEKKEYRFCWLTSIKLTRSNLAKMIESGRGRWQIENEGFNVQKNILYNIEHLNSRNPVAMKNHYLLTQIADILMQLYLRSNEMVKEYRQGIKNTSSRLLESFRRQTVTVEDVLYIERRTSVYLE